MPDEHKFEIDDNRSFSENLADFSKLVESMDGTLGPALVKELKLLEGGADLHRDNVLDRLFASFQGETK